MTTATKTKPKPTAPAAPPQREWQVGDRVRILDAVRSVGELATITDTEPPVGCFVVPDSGMFAMYVSHSGLELVEAAPDKPAVAVAVTIAEPPAAAIAAEIVATDSTARLAELEESIGVGIDLMKRGKTKIWAALEAVRSEKLWQTAGHPSFEAYCRDRWGWGKANSDENALAGEVLKELVLTGVPVEAIPTSTSAMSQLARAPKGQRAEVLQTAASLNGGRVTEAAVRAALKPEPPAEGLTYDEAAAIGLRVCSPDTSPEAIELGLATGYLRPTTAQPPSPTAAAHATAAPCESDILSTKTPAPVLEASEGRLEVGVWCRVEGHVGQHVIARLPSHPGGSVTVWCSRGSKLVSAADVVPYHAPPDADALANVVRMWHREAVAVMGAEAVQALLGEVVS